MKTERRHDLETNDLARHAAVWIEKLKPHSSTIFGTIIVIFGLVIVISLWGGSTNLKQQAAWDKYAKALLADDPEFFELQKISTDESFAGTPMQEWAQITYADRQTGLATAGFFIDREGTQERLESVAGIYESLITTAKVEEILNRAHYGLGRVYELQNRLEEAREQYDQVAGAYKLLASNRSEELLKPEVQESYKWLAEAKMPKRSGSGATGAKPAFEAPLPSGGFDASSIEDILGLSGDDSKEEKAEEDTDAEDKTEQPTFELDEIFMEEGTEAEQPEGESAADTPADDATESETEAETESTEP